MVRRGDRDAVTFEDGGKTHEDDFAMVIARLGPESALNLQMMYDLNAALWELLVSTWDSDAVRESRARHEQSWPRKP